MLNEEAIRAVANQRIDEHLARPLYEGYGFAALPSLIRSLFGGPPSSLPRAAVGPAEDRKTVVLFLLDGFGWSFWSRFANELPFLRRMQADGVVSPLTAQFPSSTAPHVTTIHTGLPVGSSGVFEWVYFEPDLDALFFPLLGAQLTDSGTASVEVSPSFYPSETLYEALASDGIPSYCYQSAKYARSGYSSAVTRGAHTVPFHTLPEAMIRLVDGVKQSPSPSYHFVYVDVIDGTSHRYGPRSTHVEAEIRSLFRLLEDEVVPGLRGTSSVVMLTADHGHIAVDPPKTIYVDERVPQIQSWVAHNSQGRPLAPAGSPRDQFLYLKDEYIDEAEETLSAALKDEATVHRVQTLMDDGYFGPVGDRFRARAASLVILPQPHQMVWWREGGRYEIKKPGFHGGLSRDELEVPLMCWCP